MGSCCASVTAMSFVTRATASLLRKGLQQQPTLVRCVSATSVVNNADDPVQKLFLNKLNEYKEKSADLPEGDLFDVLPEIEEEKKFMIDNIVKRYGPGMEEVPKFSWQ